MVAPLGGDVDRSDRWVPAYWAGQWAEDDVIQFVGRKPQCPTSQAIPGRRPGSAFTPGEDVAEVADIEAANGRDRQVYGQVEGDGPGPVRRGAGRGGSHWPRDLAHPPAG